MSSKLIVGLEKFWNRKKVLSGQENLTGVKIPFAAKLLGYLVRIYVNPMTTLSKG